MHLDPVAACPGADLECQFGRQNGAPWELTFARFARFCLFLLTLAICWQYVGLAWHSNMFAMGTLSLAWQYAGNMSVGLAQRIGNVRVCMYVCMYVCDYYYYYYYTNNGRSAASRLVFGGVRSPPPRGSVPEWSTSVENFSRWFPACQYMSMPGPETILCVVKRHSGAPRRPA